MPVVPFTQQPEADLGEFKPTKSQLLMAGAQIQGQINQGQSNKTLETKPKKIKNGRPNQS